MGRGRLSGSQRTSGRDKRSWRRARLPGLEEFLDDQRLQERLGTDFANKPDDELFVIDVEPSKNDSKNKDNKRSLTKAERKLLLLKKEPSCFQSLKNESKVPALSGDRTLAKASKISHRTIEKKAKKGILQKKAENAKRNRDLHTKKKNDVKAAVTDFSKDLWDDDEAKNKIVSDEVKEWLTQDTLVSNKFNKKLRKTQEHKVSIPAIPAPHEGMSYNPSFKAHQDLIQNVIGDELKVIKEEEHLERVTSKMFRKVTAAEKQKEELEQLRQGLNEEENEENDGGDYVSINPPVVNKKKDLKTRRHIREEKEFIRQHRVAAREKKKLADIYKLRFFKKEIEDQEVQSEKKKVKRLARKKKTDVTPKICSRRFEEPPSAYQTAEDLSGNLRNIKPQGGGLIDHFVSLQRRGIASVSTLKTQKRLPKKKYTLATHRMPWEQFEKPMKSKKKTSNN